MAKILVTGGAGFIGTNLVHRLVRQGHQVTVFDNLSRQGTADNLAWLRKTATNGFTFVEGDIRNYSQILSAAKGAEIVYHLAAQVAVTTSVTDPRLDFEANALGTFNALEAARHAGNNPIFIFASTNKVYGNMENVPVIEERTRYTYRYLPYGISESETLDFHSPYGCSKGAGDQYVRDYARIYGLRTVVFRQSCIYGPRQMGIEDQGWVAWFVIAALLGRSITIYGDGKQVRDVLHVDDLLDAFQAAVDYIDVAAGRIYNVGGGPGYTTSVWAEFGPLLEELLGHKIPIIYGDWRPGDQRIYISDIRKIQQELNWSPKIELREGARQLVAWVSKNRELFEQPLVLA